MSINSISLVTSKSWWFITVKGITIILLGAFILLYPIREIQVLVTYIGFVLLFSGIFLLAFAIGTHKENKSWGWQLAGGILDIFVACILLTNTGHTAAFLPGILGFYSVFFGLTWIVQAVLILRNKSSFWSLALLNGVLGFVLGILILNNPVFSVTSISSIMGILFIFHGFFLTILSFQIKKAKLFIYSFN
jgi:uncharacterized membrane protein HdeD (DUF308 family)